MSLVLLSWPPCVGFRICRLLCRIDYHLATWPPGHLATSGIAATARREHIYLEQRFSDHAPLVIDYDFKL